MANTKSKSRAGMAKRVMAERRKMFIACGLLLVMGLMWVKVLSSKDPVSASAQILEEQAATKTLKVTRVELPFIDGRHNVLKRDLFIFSDSRSSNVEVKKAGNFEGIGSWVVGRLRLEAIELGQRPQAFINDELVGLGSKLPVRDGDRTYVLEVVSIEDNKVTLICDGFEVSLGFGSTESE